MSNPWCITSKELPWGKLSLLNAYLGTVTASSIVVSPSCPSLPAPQEKSWPWSLRATLWDSPQATCTMCCPASAPICSEGNRGKMSLVTALISQRHTDTRSGQICMQSHSGECAKPQFSFKTHPTGEKAPGLLKTCIKLSSSESLVWRSQKAGRYTCLKHNGSQPQRHRKTLFRNRYPRLEASPLSFDSGIIQHREDRRPCKTYLTFQSSHVQWRWVIYKAGCHPQSTHHTLIYCLMCMSYKTLHANLGTSLNLSTYYYHCQTLTKKKVAYKGSKMRWRNIKKKKNHNSSPLEDNPQLTFHHYIMLGNWSRFDNYSKITYNQILLITPFLQVGMKKVLFFNKTLEIPHNWWQSFLHVRQKQSCFFLPWANTSVPGGWRKISPCKL